jgi:hypothetical protein
MYRTGRQRESAFFIWHQGFQGGLVRLIRSLPEEHKTNQFDLGMLAQIVNNRLQGDGRSFLHRITVGTGADGGEGHAGDAVLGGELQGVLVNAGQQFGVTRRTPVDWAYTVNDVFGSQPVAAGEARLTYRTSTQRPAFGQQFWPGRAVNRSVNAATAQQAGVSRVYNRLSFLLRNVPFHQFQYRLVDMNLYPIGTCRHFVAPFPRVIIQLCISHGSL